MLLAERARAAQLEQIIKELQRHRFGYRADTLPDSQLLSLKRVKQVKAGRDAAIVATNAAERSDRTVRYRKNGGSLPSHLPRGEMPVDVDDHVARAAAIYCTGSARM